MTKNAQTVDVSELQHKLEGIEKKITQLEEDRDHLRWFLAKYGSGKRAKPVAATSSSQAESPTEDVQEAGTDLVGKEMVLEGVLNILKGRGPMKSNDIFDALHARGIRVKRGSFDSLMSGWQRSSAVPITKPVYAHYQYEEKAF